MIKLILRLIAIILMALYSYSIAAEIIIQKKLSKIPKESKSMKEKKEKKKKKVDKKEIEIEYELVEDYKEAMT